jgi:3-oxoacyl-[acyl-carrier protein] reductase
VELGLQDRVFLVTGGARGLGRATAEVLVTEGARVVLSGRTQETLDAAVGELGDRAVGEVADNADPEAPARLIVAAQETFGRLDGALISVGGPPAGTVMQVSDEDWSQSFDTVFLGALRLAREVALVLGEGGSIALVLSSTVKVPIGNLAISNGLRPGLAMLTKGLADELGPKGIRVNALLPGRVDTERVRELDELSDDPDATRRGHEEGIPLRRYGQPEEFGRVAAFLMSPASSFVSGVMLPVDGGMLRTL